MQFVIHLYQSLYSRQWCFFCHEPPFGVHHNLMTVPMYIRLSIVCSPVWGWRSFRLLRLGFVDLGGSGSCVQELENLGSTFCRHVASMGASAVYRHPISVSVDILKYFFRRRGLYCFSFWRSRRIVNALGVGSSSCRIVLVIVTDLFSGLCLH